MPVRKPAASPDVDTFLRLAAHPMDATIRALRAVVLATDARIGEDIKWNAPSFHVDGKHFATMQLRRPDCVLLVMHLGAGKRTLPHAAIDDPDGLLTWLGADRATCTFTGVQDVGARATPLQSLLRQWMDHV